MKKLRNLKRLYISGNKFPEMPPEIIEKNMDRPHVILDYILNLQGSEGAKPLNEMKLIIVGQGGVGKTSLVSRLTRDTYIDKEVKTAGIQISDLTVPWGEESLKVNIWDFGGQEIMHATHQFFLTKRSLYVLVIDARQGEQDSKTEYWLKLINSFGANSPTIVVINKTDEHPLDLNKSGLKKKYPFIQGFFDVSCKSGVGLEELKSSIISEAKKLEHLRDMLPLSWFKAKEKLGEMDTDYISFERYLEIAAECGVHGDDTALSLIDLLHDLGIVLNFRDDLKLQETNVLNPDWATNGVYKILNSFELFHAKGVLRFKDLRSILPEKRYPIQKHNFIIELMKKFEICFEYDDPNDVKYLIPDLLSRDQPDINWDYSESLAFEIHYDVFPSSIISRFIVRNNHLISLRTYWHSGVVLESEGNKALVVADFEDKKIFVWINGVASTRRAFLMSIRQSFASIHSTIPKISAVEKVPFKGAAIDYLHLRNLELMGETHLVPEGLNERISISSILVGIDDGKQIVSPSSSPQTATIDPPQRAVLSRLAKEPMQMRSDPLNGLSGAHQALTSNISGAISFFSGVLGFLISYYELQLSILWSIGVGFLFVVLSRFALRLFDRGFLFRRMLLSWVTLGLGLLSLWPITAIFDIGTLTIDFGSPPTQIVAMIWCFGLIVFASLALWEARVSDRQ